MSEFQLRPFHLPLSPERGPVCVTDTRKGGRGRERAKREEETKNFTFLFSILVTKVTPSLYINMAKEPLCLSSLPLQAPVLSLQ